MENEGENTDHQETVFVIRVSGFAPELMRGAAFRTDKHIRAKGKKILKCPYAAKTLKPWIKT